MFQVAESASDNMPFVYNHEFMKIERGHLVLWTPKFMRMDESFPLRLGDIYENRDTSLVLNGGTEVISASPRRKGSSLC